MTGQGCKLLKLALPLFAALVLAACDGGDSGAASASASNGSLNGSGTASLSWSPPTANTDGSALTDLTGYRIYYGTNATSLSYTVDIPTVGLTAYVIPNLSTGTWYFAIKAYNSLGVESDLSNTATKTIS